MRIGAAWSPCCPGKLLGRSLPGSSSFRWHPACGQRGLAVVVAKARNRFTDKVSTLQVAGWQESGNGLSINQGLVRWFSKGPRLPLLLLFKFRWESPAVPGEPEAGWGGRGNMACPDDAPGVLVGTWGPRATRVLGLQAEPILGFARNSMTQSPTAPPLWPANDVAEIYYLRWAPFC